jgi:hypothetical protein
MIEDKLYKRGISLPFLRCLSPIEATHVMYELHEGICGNHSGSECLVRKLITIGYYWPTMKKDALRYVKQCDKCQQFSNVSRLPSEELTLMTCPSPFAQWGIDLVGPLPLGKSQLKFVVIAIDYFTKWVEAEPLDRITKLNIKNFI